MAEACKTKEERRLLWRSSKKIILEVQMETMMSRDTVGISGIPEWLLQGKRDKHIGAGPF